MASRKIGIYASLGLLVLLLPVLVFSFSWAARLLSQQEMAAIRGGSNNPPVAVAQVNPGVAAVDDTVNFNGQWSYDPDGDTISFSWDFDDQQSSTQMNPTHYYDEWGSYTPVLTVTDHPVWYSSLSDTDSVSVTAIQADISTPSYNTKIAFPSVVVLGYAKPHSLGESLDWSTTVGGNQFTTTTQSGVGGTVTVSTFPSSNSAFGPNTVSAEMSYQSASDEGTQPVKYFFWKTGTQNPDGNVPNWYYYWSQTSASSGTHVYKSGNVDNEGVGACAYYVWGTGDTFFTILDPCDVSIDIFGKKCRHESAHLQDYQANWGTGPVYVNQDSDGDRMRDSWELANGFDPTTPYSHGGNADDDREYNGPVAEATWVDGSVDSEDWSRSGAQW